MHAKEIPCYFPVNSLSRGENPCVYTGLMRTNFCTGKISLLFSLSREFARGCVLGFGSETGGWLAGHRHAAEDFFDRGDGFFDVIIGGVEVRGHSDSRFGAPIYQHVAL